VTTSIGIHTVSCSLCVLNNRLNIKNQLQLPMVVLVHSVSSAFDRTPISPLSDRITQRDHFGQLIRELSDV